MSSLRSPKQSATKQGLVTASVIGRLKSKLSTKFSANKHEKDSAQSSPTTNDLINQIPYNQNDEQVQVKEDQTEQTTDIIRLYTSDDFVCDKVELLSNTDENDGDRHVVNNTKDKSLTNNEVLSIKTGRLFIKPQYTGDHAVNHYSDDEDEVEVFAEHSNEFDNQDSARLLLQDTEDDLPHDKAAEREENVKTKGIELKLIGTSPRKTQSNFFNLPDTFNPLTDTESSILGSPRKKQRPLISQLDDINDGKLLTNESKFDESASTQNPQARLTMRGAKADAVILTSAYSSDEIESTYGKTLNAHLKLQTKDQQDSKECHDETKSENQNFGENCAFIKVPKICDSGEIITREFGARIANLLGADLWADRQDGFDAIQFVIKQTDLVTAPNSQTLFCAALAAIRGGIDDKVAPVAYGALGCLRTIIQQYADILDINFVDYPEIESQMYFLVKALLQKLTECNKRTQKEAGDTLDLLVKYPLLKTTSLVITHLNAPDSTPRLCVEALGHLLGEIGDPTSENAEQLSIDAMMDLILPALNVPDEKTRKIASELIAQLHLSYGQQVNNRLTGIRPEIVRVINQRTEEVILQHKQQEDQKLNSNQSDDKSAEPFHELESIKGCPLLSCPSPDSGPILALISEQLDFANRMLGPVIWRKLECTTWNDRKEALLDIEKKIADSKSELRGVKPQYDSPTQHQFAAYCNVIYKMLGDNIFPVINSVIDCFNTLVKTYGGCVEWRENSIRDIILLTILKLFTIMQKPNTRTNRSACRAVLRFARLSSRYSLQYTISCIFHQDTDLYVRLQLLRVLIPEFGFHDDGLSPGLTLETVSKGFLHGSEKVRKSATDVALSTQRLIGKEYVLAKLRHVKPATLKELEQIFFEVMDQQSVQSGDSTRPKTVHASGTDSSSLSPITESSRRNLQSAPVGSGGLFSTPSIEKSNESHENSRNHFLSTEEEILMDSILQA